MYDSRWFSRVCRRRVSRLWTIESVLESLRRPVRVIGSLCGARSDSKRPVVLRRYLQIAACRWGKVSKLAACVVESGLASGSVQQEYRLRILRVVFGSGSRRVYEALEVVRWSVFWRA